MKVFVQICVGIIVLAAGGILVAWHFMTRTKNKEKTAAAREARWQEKSVENAGDPTFKTPSTNGQVQPVTSIEES